MVSDIAQQQAVLGPMCCYIEGLMKKYTEILKVNMKQGVSCDKIYGNCTWHLSFKYI